MVTSAFVALLCQSLQLTMTRNIKLANQLQNLGLSDLAIAAGSCSLFNTSFPSLSVKRTFFHWQYHVSPRASLDGFRILIEIYAGKKITFRMTTILLSLSNSTSLCLHT